MSERIHRAGAAWLLSLWALVAVSAGAALAERPAPLSVGETRLRPVTVEVLGFASLGGGASHGDAHAAALVDARRNALVQAHSIVTAVTLVAGMRVTEDVVWVCAAGYVQELHVLEAGVMPDSDPPVYRVRARAVVHPFERGDAGAAGFAIGQRTPAVVLDVSPDVGVELRDPLANGLRRCGLRVVARDERTPAIVARVGMTVAAEEGTSRIAARWQMMLGDAAAEAGNVPAASGQWLLTADSTFDPGVDRLSVAMAQDALRLWLTPRQTRVRFKGLAAMEASALAAAVGRARVGSWEPEGPPGDGALARLRVVGDPIVAVESLLAQADLSGRFVPGEVSLTDLSYVRAPENVKAASPEAE